MDIAGFYNEAPTTVHDIIYQTIKEPSALPSVVLQHLSHFAGPEIEINGNKMAE